MTTYQTTVEEIQPLLDALQAPEDDQKLTLDVVSLARAYSRLGQFGKAIAVYETTIEKGYRVRTLFHNVGRLYENVDEYEKAIESYGVMIDDYGDQDYFFDIAWAYVKAGNAEGARHNYDQWSLIKNKTDRQLEQAIDKLDQ